MQTIAIIQARMGSRRLKGKVLKQLGDLPVLQHVINRSLASKKIDKVIVATSVENQDDAIFTYCNDRNIHCFRGEENNVLLRYLNVAKKISAEVIVRITADCPLLSPQIIDAIINLRNKNQADYVSNTLKRTYPQGLDVECFTFQALELAANSAQIDYDFEHVTPYIYGHPTKFKLASLENSEDFSHVRLTLDFQSDYLLFQKLFRFAPLLNNPNFPWEEVVKLIENNDELKYLHQTAKKEAAQ
jgi:spore coat polysaccharide biosynthesis protein SpsF